MRKHSTIFTLAALAVAILFTTGCSDEPAGPTHDSATTDVDVHYLDVCKNPAVTGLDVVCVNPLKIKRTVFVNSADDGKVGTDVKELEITRPAGQLLASDSFPPCPVEAGQFAEQHFGYPGLIAPDGYRLLTCGGNARPTVLKDLGANICLKWFTSGGGDNGSGTAPVCLKAKDVKDNTFDIATECSAEMDGEVIAEADEVPEGVTCDGFYVASVPAKGSTSHDFKVTCDDGKLVGEKSADIIEDQVNNVLVTVLDPDAHLKGSFCGSGYDDEGNLIDVVDNHCSLVLLNLEGTQPVPTTAPDGIECGEDNQIYIEGVMEGTYTVEFLCDFGKGSGEVTIVAQGHVVKDFVIYSSVQNGHLCLVDTALLVDTVTPKVDLEHEVGLGDSEGSCDPNAINDYLLVTVTALSGPDCQDLNDANCRLQVSDDQEDVGDPLLHLIWESRDFSGMTPGEIEIFSMGLEDSDSATSILKNFWVYNGVSQSAQSQEESSSSEYGSSFQELWYSQWDSNFHEHFASLGITAIRGAGGVIHIIQ